MLRFMNFVYHDKKDHLPPPSPAPPELGPSEPPPPPAPPCGPFPPEPSLERAERRMRVGLKGVAEFLKLKGRD